MPRSHRWTIVLCVCFHLIGLSVLAQSGEQVWSAPVNLSHSGAASEPVVISGLDGTLHVFWWDQFNGLTQTRWDGEAWSAAVASPINVYQEARGQGAPVSLAPIEVMPLLTGDVNGQAHALWLGEPDEETEALTLMYSRLMAGGTSWSVGSAVAQSALVWHLEADPVGTLHLAYVRPQHSDASPAGVYYRRSTDGGVTWSTSQVLHSSMYLRLLSREEAHLEVVAGGEGQVYVIWDDPRLEIAFYTRSTDGGLTWDEPQVIGDPEEGSKRARVIFGHAGDGLLLWQPIRAAGGCAFYQQPAGDSTAPRRVLEELTRCPEEIRFLRTVSGQVLLVASGDSGGLTLAAWDGSVDQWSEPKWLGFSFEDPELERQIYLESLQATLVGGDLAVVGQGQGGDVWFLESQVDALEWAFAPPSSWSEPVNLSQSEGLPGLPVVATDAEGLVHVLWSEATGAGLPGSGLHYAGYNGTRWTQPVKVLSVTEGKAEQPALTIVGDRLHAVWSGGLSGKILYSWAYLRDAYAPGGWSEPQPLPAPGEVGSAPVIVADLVGTLHVVYAVPLNEGRGIYYTRSDDDGETWSEAQVIFDATSAGWAMVDHPSLAVDVQGILHVVWVRAPLPGSGLPEGVYYVRSVDGGTALPSSERVWSEPVQVAEGAYDWPCVVTTRTDQVHLMWGGVDVSLGWTHQWSVDGGAEWTRPERVGRFADVPGPVALVGDGADILHLVGVGEDDAGEPALLYTTWKDGRWGDLETFRLTPGTDGVPGVAVALRSALGQLDVAFRGEAKSEEDEAQMNVFYASRSIPVVEVTPVLALTPRPTATPTPGPTPLPTLTPRPKVNPEAPLSAPPALSLGPVTLPFMSLGGLALAAFIVILVGGVALRPLWMGRR